ncbi:oxidoreductase [Mycena galopus ATCC 62051]|nr:oxidoreductase [Mycena galopus ATCC 62051]
MASSSRVALVTGCSAGGIGFYMCKALVERDFVVYATARSLSSMEDLDHPNIKRLVLDVTKDSQVNSVVSTIIAESGRIDLLINNAGFFAVGPLTDWTAENVKDVYDTNVFSIVRVCGAIIPHMAKCKSGTIINMGSVVGKLPLPWSGVYDSSKFALRTLTEVYSMECKPLNICVMLAAPGTIQSKLADKQDDFELASGSLYTAFLHNIHERIESSKAKVTETERFAEQVISKAVQENPPRYFAVGGYVSTFRFLSYVPRSIPLWVCWRLYSKPR